MIMLIVKNFVCRLPLAVLVFCLTASAQKVELNGGATHISGDQGLDGFTVGAAVWFTHRVSIAADYDGVWDTSKIGQFELTQTGLIVSRSHLQDYLFGPRISFPGIRQEQGKTCCASVALRRSRVRYFPSELKAPERGDECQPVGLE
jgi:hypothetical protein